jgi:hypothetical protein
VTSEGVTEHHLDARQGGQRCHVQWEATAWHRMAIAPEMLAMCHMCRCHAAGQWYYFNNPPSRSRDTMRQSRLVLGRDRRDQLIAQTLMIVFVMIVLDEFADGSAE